MTIFILFYIRLEKEYTIIRKEEQEEQVEIRVCSIFYLIPCCKAPCFLL